MGDFNVWSRRIVVYDHISGIPSIQMMLVMADWFWSLCWPLMENDMATFDPMQTIDAYADTECSVQLLVPDAKAFHCSSIGEALSYASKNGGKWNGVELTVHRDREDIVYGTDKTRMLIAALERASRTRDPRQKAADME